MGLKSLSKALWTRWARTNAHPEKKRRLHLQVEELEGRWAPAVLQPTTFADGLNIGSLRDAVIQADTNGQNNTIELAAGTYNLTLAGRGQSNSQSGALNLNAAGFTETIEGKGLGITIIDANRIDRVFQVIGPVTVVFQDLTITGGLATDSGTVGGNAALGGGILNNGGSVALERVSVTDNVAHGSPGQDAFGGGIYSKGTSLTISDSTISYNQALGGDGTAGANGGIGQNGGPGQNGGNAAGGGVFVAGGKLLVKDSTISHNQAKGGAGGAGGNGGGNNVARTTVVRTTTGFSGTVNTSGFFTTTGGTSTGGTPTGGTSNFGTTWGGSTSGGTFGGTSAGSFAAVPMAASPATGGASGNGGDGGLGGRGRGGGLFVANGMVSLVNSTVAENLASGGNGGNGGDPGQTGSGGNGGDGGVSQGGGLFLELGNLDLTNDTIAYNNVLDSGGGLAGAGNPNNGIGQPSQGGGIFNQGGTVNAFNTLLGDNTAALAPDFSGNFQNAGYDLLADGTGANLINGVNGNQVGTASNPINPLLGSLADNGGPTQTVALMPGSPAVNAGSNALAVDSQGQPLAFDQRGPGFPRIASGTVDIGSFELQATAAPLGTSPNAIYVENVYALLLHRAADPGAGYWVQQLNNGVPPAQVVQAIEKSPEYLNNVVTSLYEHDLNRAPDPGGAQYWVNALENGTSIEQVTAGIVSSQEFFQKEAEGTDAGYVTALYQYVLNRIPEPGGYAAWLDALHRGESRAAVAMGFLTSQEFRDNLVSSYYQEFLRRSPDPGGLAAWVQALQKGRSDQVVLAAILGSSEGFSDWS